MLLDTIIVTIFSTAILGANLVSPFVDEKILASHQISLEKRYYPVQKDNILLNMAYMQGNVKSKTDIDWDEIRKPFEYRFILEPGKTFAYHDDVLPEFKDKIALTTNAHFNSQEGFKSYGYLVGDGVCHSASLIYWVAKDAGLDVVVPTNHNFMAIPEIDKKYGVSIYVNPFARGSHTKQNLYVTNNKENPVVFKFKYDGNELELTIVEEN